MRIVTTPTKAVQVQSSCPMATSVRAAPVHVVRSRAGLGLLGVALAARVGALALSPHYFPGHDDRSYLVHAIALARTGHFPIWPVPGGVVPTAYRAPGFPALLATAERVAGDGLAPLRDTQVGVGVVLVALIGVVGGRLWGRRVGLTAMALAALSPVLIVFGASLESEPLFAALVMAAVATALRARDGRHRLGWAILAGALAGAAALTRSEGLLLVPAIALVAAPAARAWPAALAVVLAAAVAVAPWTARNADVMHAFVPVSTETGNTLAGTYNDRARTDPQWRWGWRDPRLDNLYSDVRYAHRFDEPGVDRALERAVAVWVLHHPLAPLEVAVTNAPRLTGFAPPAWSALSLRTTTLPVGFAPALQLGLVATSLLALAGATDPRARRLPLAARLVGILIALVALLINCEQRFAVPLQPWLLLLAALPVSSVLSRARPGTRRWRGARLRRAARA